MTDGARKHAEDLRGASRLAVEATRGVTDLVQAMHDTISDPIVRVFSAPVYATVRGVTSIVGGILDVALGQLAPLLGASIPGTERDAILAAVNGVLGDYLAETNNPLAIEMCLHGLEAAAPKSKLVVFVHGSAMSVEAWQAAGDLGASPLHLHYNSGLHISTNGRAFAALLEDAVRHWPMPVQSIAIVAHSMGGLVTRSACHYAEEEGLAWREKLSAIVFLGTPHHGAPLERRGNWLQTLFGLTRYSAPFARLGRLRSAGVTDLRFGNVLDEDWRGRDRFAPGRDARTPVPLPHGVSCFAVAAENDALVPCTSAFGEHDNPAFALAFPASHRFVAEGTGHLDLLRTPHVWQQIERWLGT